MFRRPAALLSLVLTLVGVPAGLAAPAEATP